MNTVKKAKVRVQKTKLIRRTMRLRKNVRNGRKRLPSRSVLKRKAQKTVKKAEARKVVEPPCECKKILENAKELSHRFQDASKSDFHIEGVQVNRNKKQKMEEIEPLVEKRAFQIMEEMRYEWNEKKLRLCANCLQAQIQFFRRMYRWMIHYTLDLQHRCGDWIVGFHKVKKCYFELLAKQTRNETQRLYWFFDKLKEKSLSQKSCSSQCLRDRWPKIAGVPERLPKRRL